MSIGHPFRRWLPAGVALVGLSLLAGCGLLGSPAGQPTTAGSARPPSPPRVGVLHLNAEIEAPVVVGLRRGLADLGYVEGRDVILEIRSGRGRPEAAEAAARELIGAGVRVLVSAGTASTQAAQAAAGNLPIVFTQVGDPVAAGFAQSLAHPGGNTTGFSSLLPATTGKRLELLREIAPGVRTVLTIYDPANPSSASSAEVARGSAEPLGVTLSERHVKSREEVSAALREVSRATVDAIVVLPDSLVANAGDEIIEAAGRERLPVMFHEDSWVRRGGLASYGPSFTDLGRQAATYVDKILRGAAPSDLPVQQATTFDLVINLKTAQDLGLTIPRSVLERAAEVVQ